jgi:hypothetical protein
MRFLIATILSFITLNVSAVFTLSGGNEILQTGIDNNLDSLVLVPGVTTITVNDITIYRLPNRRLRIRGTLTIDPEIEMLIIEAPNNELLIADNNGHLTIGRAITQNGYTRYSVGTAIYFENTAAGYTNRVSFTGNSSLTWNGGTVSIYAGKFGFYGDNVTVRINSTNAKLIYRTQDSQNQIRQETDDFISTGFTFINGDLTIVGHNQQLNGYSPEHCTGSLAFSGATPNVDVIIRGYAGGNKGNSIDIKHWSGSRPVLINAEFGSQLNCGPHISGNGGSYGVARVFQDVQVNVVDNTNTPITGVHYFIRDTDHANRNIYTREAPSIDSTADIIYTGTTDGSGATNVFSVLLAMNVANNGNADAPNIGNYAWDYRGKNNDNSDLFDITLMGYNHTIGQLSDVELKGVDTLSLKSALIPDGNITEPLFTNALAISGISVLHNVANDSGVINITGNITLCDLYDYLKAEKINTSKEEPTVVSLVANPVGNEVFIGNYQLNFSVAGMLDACNKFQKVNSNLVSSIINPNNNLGVALQDPNGTYKLIRLEGLDSANVTIYDEVGDSNLFVASDTSGTIQFVTQNNNDSISILIERTDYTSWASFLDFNSADVFNYIVNQAKITSGSIFVDQATLENQEESMYLLLKLLQKNEAILNTLDDSVSTTLNVPITTTIGTSASKENQEEIKQLLHLLLFRTVGIRERLTE